MTKTLAVIACLTSSMVLAQTVPGSISFNARLTDTGGAPITGSRSLGFGLYDAASGGAALWTENISGASFSTDGLTFVELGASTPLTPAALDGRKLYLEVSVDGTTMTPRLAIVAVPYAIRASVAASALTVGSLNENAIQRRVTGTCNAGQAVRSIDASGGVQCENLSTGGGGDITSVTTAAGSGLTGGATSGDIALSLSTCANGEVLKSNGTGWACGGFGVASGGGLAVSGSGNFGLTTTCSTGEVLKYNGTSWACAADSTGSVSAGTGLTLTGNTLSVNFGGNGSANTAARSDHAHGAIYTRWGVSTCPAGNTLVYSGFTAGAHYTQSGSGGNTVCLASNPIWTNPSGGLLAFNDTNQDESLIYGTEYEVGNGVIGLGSRQDYDSVCAVCIQPNANITFMYPGAATCPSGWTTEYFGYLMANQYQQAKSSYICVDVNPAAAGSNGNSNGNLLYATEAECGSLPCGAGQYVQNREITCSVCSR